MMLLGGAGKGFKQWRPQGFAVSVLRNYAWCVTPTTSDSIFIEKMKESRNY